MQAILNFIVDILSQPAILVALIAFIGLIVQKKPAATITSGTIKTILGFLILIARFTNLKYIFLTGHHTFYMAAFLAIILTVSHIKGWLTIVIGALVLGLIMAVLPALLQPTMRKITGNDQ